MARHLDQDATSPQRPGMPGATSPLLRGPAAAPSSLRGLGYQACPARLELGERRHYLGESSDAFETRLADVPGAGDVSWLPDSTFLALARHHGGMPVTAPERAGFTVASDPAWGDAVTDSGHVPGSTGVDEQRPLNGTRVEVGMDNTPRQVEQSAAPPRQLVERLPAVTRRAAVWRELWVFS